tara:strand:- start:1284 stop:1496 length:213 start_codon:yes stop_codon:yes gene_type:complete
MSKKYVVWCNQREQYFGATHNLKDTTHFKSLDDIKKWLLDYHNDVDVKILKTYNAYQIANQFDWKIQQVK